MKGFFKRMKEIASGKSGALVTVAAFMMVVAEIAPNLCVFPAWHYEPEMPAHLRSQLEK